MRALIAMSMLLSSACAIRAPAGKELWVPREEAVRPGGAVGGAQLWVPEHAPLPSTAKTEYWFDTWSREKRETLAEEREHTR